MKNHDLAKATELRWKAAQWRRCAAETGLHNYIALMERAARDLETQADELEQHAGLDEPQLQRAAS
jgi:hypothetical protein